MWTNHPTVDSGNVLDFGPIEYFKTDLDPEDLYGLMSNPFQRAQFNKTVIPMVCQYTWNLKDYDCYEVYNDSMKYVMDTEEPAEAMLIFTNHNSKRGSEGEGSQELINAIATFEANITKENAEAVLAEINKIIEACDVLLTEDKYTTMGMYEQLYPYANSLRENQTSIMLAADSDVEAELETRDTLSSYLDEQLALVIAADYYHDTWTEVIDQLNNRKDELEETTYADLPTLDELKTEVEELLEAYEDRKPIKKESNVVSTDKEVSAGNLENPTDYPVSNIIDGNRNTTCSTVMGDPENPAYVQIDLGESMPLQEIWVACYVGNDRWHKYDVYTSVDGVTYELLENKDSEMTETAKGNWFDADGVTAGYVKLVGIANSINVYFHVGEIKVYAKDADYTPVDEAIAKVPADLTIYTDETVAAVNDAVAAVVRDKNAAEQSEVDAMAKAINDAITALEFKKAGTFEDVTAADFYYNAVEWALGENIVSGKSETIFAPADSGTRGDVVTFLWRAAGCPEPASTESPFEDVVGYEYYYKAVLWAVEEGIASGTSATRFSPNVECTRAQVVTFLWRASGSVVVDAEEPFEDVEEYAYYYDAVRWAVSEGITEGKKETVFDPDGACTRGEIVTFLYRNKN